MNKSFLFKKCSVVVIYYRWAEKWAKKWENCAKKFFNIYILKIITNKNKKLK